MRKRAFSNLHSIAALRIASHATLQCVCLRVHACEYTCVPSLNDCELQFGVGVVQCEFMLQNENRARNPCLPPGTAVPSPVCAGAGPTFEIRPTTTVALVVTRSARATYGSFRKKILWPKAKPLYLKLCRLPRPGPKTLRSNTKYTAQSRDRDYMQLQTLRQSAVSAACSRIPSTCAVHHAESNCAWPTLGSMDGTPDPMDGRVHHRRGCTSASRHS